MIEKKKIALLIDGENFPLDDLNHVVPQLEKTGDIVIRRAFFFHGQTTERLKQLLSPHFIEIVGFYDGPRVSNATDFELYISAVELTLENNIDIFCVASSDAGFLPLVQYLQNKNKAVWGLGPSDASKALQERCDSFIVTRIVAPSTSKKQKKKAKKEKKAKANKAQKKKVAKKKKQAVLSKERSNALIRFIVENQDGGGWIPISVVIIEFFQPRRIIPERQGCINYSEILRKTNFFTFEGGQNIRLK